MVQINEVILKQVAVAGEDDVLLITIEYELEFSRRDRRDNVTYHETCQLIGDDTDVPGDVGNGGDDVLLPPSKLIDQLTATDEQSVVRRTTGRRITRRTANEDPSPLAPLDELRAEVRMVDVEGQFQPVFAESKILADRF